MPGKDPNLMGIEAALRNGARLHVFRSGGGLRVVRLDHGDANIGYGEHPNLEPALEIADEDVRAGCRPYGQVYGKTETHYLTGTTEPSSPADLWVLGGHDIEAWFEDGRLVVAATGTYQVDVPLDATGPVERGLKRELFVVDDVGVVSHVTPFRFPGGQSGSTIQVVHCPEGTHDTFFREMNHRYAADSFVAALAGAFEPPPSRAVPHQVFDDLEAAMSASSAITASAAPHPGP